MENRRKFLGSCVAGLGLLACATAPSLAAKPAHAKPFAVVKDNEYVLLRKTYADVKISKTGITIASKRNLFQSMMFTGMEASVISIILKKQRSVKQISSAIANAYKIDISAAETVVSRVLSKLKEEKMLITTPVENRQKTIVIYKFKS